MKGAARQVFNFSTDVQTAKGKRPVLTTGSFTGKDTMMSVSSEMIKILDKGLDDPATNEEEAAQEQLTYQMLRAMSHKLKSSPKFRESVRNLITSNLHGIPDWAVEKILTAPLPEIYRVKMMFPNIPDWLK